MRQFGFTKNKLLHNKISGNYKLNEFSALRNNRIKRLNSKKKRNLIAKKYQENLANSNYKLLSSIKPYYCNHYKQIMISNIKRKKEEKNFKR